MHVDFAKTLRRSSPTVPVSCRRGSSRAARSATVNAPERCPRSPGPNSPQLLTSIEVTRPAANPRAGATPTPRRGTKTSPSLTSRLATIRDTPSGLRTAPSRQGDSPTPAVAARRPRPHFASASLCSPPRRESQTMRARSVKAWNGWSPLCDKAEEALPARARGLNSSIPGQRSPPLSCNGAAGSLMARDGTTELRQQPQSSACFHPSLGHYFSSVSQARERDSAFKGHQYGEDPPRPEANSLTIEETLWGLDEQMAREVAELKLVTAQLESRVAAVFHCQGRRDALLAQLERRVSPPTSPSERQANALHRAMSNPHQRAPQSHWGSPEAALWNSPEQEGYAAMGGRGRGSRIGLRPAHARGLQKEVPNMGADGWIGIDTCRGGATQLWGAGEPNVLPGAAPRRDGAAEPGKGALWAQDVEPSEAREILAKARLTAIAYDVDDYVKDLLGLQRELVNAQAAGDKGTDAEVRKLRILLRDELSRCKEREAVIAELTDRLAQSSPP